MIAAVGAVRTRSEARRVVVQRLPAILHPLPHAEVARRIEAGPTHVKRCLREDDATQWQLADALLLEVERRIAIAELVAGADHVVVPRPSAMSLRDLDDAIETMEHVTAMLRAWREAARDGLIDRTEGKAIRERSMRVARIALALAELGALAEREGVVSATPRAEGP